MVMMLAKMNGTLFTLAMLEMNVMAVLLLTTLFLLWKLDFVATLLGLRTFAAERPDSLREMWTEEEYAKARDYHGVSARFSLMKSTVSLALLLGFWLLGGFSWLDAVVHGWFPDRPVMMGLSYFGVLFAAQMVFALPWEWYDTFVIETRFGFNKATPGVFVGDQCKGLLLAVVIGAPIAGLVLWIFQSFSMPWLWAWLAFSAFQILLLWLVPVVILPLFNKFQPMEDGELKQAIEAMAQRCNFPLTGLFIMDGSKRSTKANAFFTGFGKTKKIALFDTLVEKHSVGELVAVLAHEIGHFQCRHVPQRLVASLIQTAVFFYLLGLATDANGAFARMLFDAFGVGVISAHVGMVLFMVLFSPVSTVLGVVLNAWSRKNEFEADAYAAKFSSAADLISALKKLSTSNLSHPTPHGLRVWLDYSHPPLAVRLAALEKFRS
jgi:STE24 endopeptidase